MTSTKVMKSSSNSSEFKYIPPEVLIQILANLPAQTLLRFRCVCKSWCSIIDHPDFVFMHLQLCNNNNNNQYNSANLLFIRSSRSSDTDGCVVTLRKVSTFGNICHVFRSSERYHILGRCNSLVLMCGFQNSKYNEIRICNPSIRKSLLLPPCPLHPCRVFKTTFVLGFTPRSKDFKVIAISFKRTRMLRQTEMCVAVFTLSDQQWVVRNNGLKMDCSTFGRMFNSCYCPPNNAYYSEGAAHWLGNDPYGDINDQLGGKPTHLVSLDFDTENFEFLELPIVLDETETTRFLFLLGESLAIFSISSVHSTIWVLKRESGKREWSQWFLGPSSVDGSNFFCQIGSREIARLLYYEGDGGYFVYRDKSYNIATCQLRRLGQFVSPDVQLELEMYSESLLLCKGYGAEYMASS